MKILVVEDDENSRLMLVDLLKGSGHIVQSAMNGKKALELLKDSAPNLVITDILMPEIDGFDLCRKIKSNSEWTHIPLIFYTATYTSRADQELGILMGASRFIIKPQEPDVLLKHINDVINESAKDKLPPLQTPMPANEAIERKQLAAVGEKLQKKIKELEAERIEKRALDNKLVYLASDYHKIIELLSDFKYCASHDLIEPLRKISSFSSRLREVYGKNLGEQQKVYLNAIERSSLKMKKYIDDLARFALIAKVEIDFESIDLEEIFAKVLETLSAEIKKSDAKITIESPHTLISGWQQLKEIFEHIISNSLHSKKENTPLTIHVTSQKTADSFIEIHIADSGIGFDDKYANKIFKPFQRLHRHQLDERSGMGLAICKLIVDRLGGSISAKSSPDKGATFTVKLPLEPVNTK